MVTAKQRKMEVERRRSLEKRVVRGIWVSGGVSGVAAASEGRSV